MQIIKQLQVGNSDCIVHSWLLHREIKDIPLIILRKWLMVRKNTLVDIYCGKVYNFFLV